MERVLVLGAACLLGAGLGCSTEKEEKLAQELKGSCVLNSDCKGELVCAFGRCHTQCTSSEKDCPRDARCVRGDDGELGVCQFEDEAVCEVSKDCEGEYQQCASDGLCHDGCDEKDECAPTQVCAAEGVCAETDEVSSSGELSSQEPNDAATGGEAKDADPPQADAASTAMDAESSDAGATNQPIGDSAVGGVFKLLPGDRNLEGAAVVATRVTEPTEWKGRIHVTKPIDVTSDLVIAEGTEVIVAPNAGIRIGGGEFAVQGTAEKPVRFYGEKQGKGTWAGLTITSTASVTTRLSHVLIAEAGAGTNGYGLSVDQVIHLNDVQVLDSGGDGVVASTFSDASLMLSVFGAKGTAVILKSELAITNFPRGGKFEGNGQDVALIQLGLSAYTEDVTFHEIGMPYLQVSEMSAMDCTFRMEAGVDYRIATDTSLRIGPTGHPTTLEILGTAEAPVVFQGAEGDASDKNYWVGVVMDATLKVNSVVNHLVIRHAGLRDEYALKVLSPIVLSHVTLEQGAGGLYIGPGLAPSSEAISIRDSDRIPLTTTLDGLINLSELGAPFSFENNADSRIQVDGGSTKLSGTIPNWGLPYRFPGSIEVNGGARWIIEPGVEFQMGFNTLLDFTVQQPTLQAIGTEADSIIFSGEMVDEVPERWQGLRVNATSVSALEWVEISDAGLEIGACLAAVKPISVTHSTFTDCLGYGIQKTASDMTDYLSTNNFYDVELEVGE